MWPVAIMAVSLAACAFDVDPGAAHFRCESSADCPDGLECLEGWCEEPGPPLADAGPPDRADLGCPCSLWDDATVPEQLDNFDGQAIEVGLKFRADVAGRVIGLRFYKPALSTGLHVGRLWSDEGALLGAAEYEGETASGWQVAALVEPVAVEADTTYLASVYIDSGHYAADVKYFLATHDRPPLHALADGIDGSNGVFTPGMGFPDLETFMSTNYWVDVVFEDD